MANGLSAEHISTNLAAYEAARTGFFTLVVYGLNGIESATWKGEDKPEEGSTDLISTNAEEELKLNVVKAPVPHFSLQKLTYRRGNEVVNFAGVPEFRDGQITVDDVVGLKTKDILMAWQAKAYNVHTRKGGRMWEYKKTCDLMEYTQDFDLVRTWKLEGCWIQDITEGDFDKENDGKRQITASIVYDYAYIVDNATAKE